MKSDSHETQGFKEIHLEGHKHNDRAGGNSENLVGQ
jgi:hypothetical protein